MADEPTAGATQAVADASTVTQAVTPTTTPATQAVNGKTPLSADDYERKLAEANKEAAANRVELKKYKEAEEAAKLAAMGDLEKAQAQAKQLEKQIETYKTELVNSRVREAAITKGIIDPEIAALALKDKLEYGDDGMPTNLEKALDDLVKAKPYLLTQADSAAQTASTKTPPTTPANSPSRSGRSDFVQSGATLPQGQRVSLHDLQWKK